MIIFFVMHFQLNLLMNIVNLKVLKHIRDSAVYCAIPYMFILINYKVAKNIL
jgi:hypothetical protein